MTKLAVIATHPIQYYAPVFRLLTERRRVQLKVFYTWGEGGLRKYDPGFGKEIEWDIPLLEGYDYQFVENTSRNPGSDRFWGIVNPGLVRDVEEWEAETVLIFGWSYEAHLRAMRHFKSRIPVYFRGDSTLLDEGPGLKRLLRRGFLRWVYRHVDKAFYVGTRNREYYEAHGLRGDRLVFAPHAIDNGRFADGPKKNYMTQARKWRRKLGIADDDVAVLFAGKLEPKKDPMLLLKAVQKLNAERIHPLKLVFAGDGVLEGQLKAAAAGDPHIHFTGFQNQRLMPVVYRLGDIFCLPSQGSGETWGLAVNEAMACGRAVIVSDKAGCAADLVQMGQNGFVFSHGDIGDLSEKLDRTANPETVRRMGGASAAIIEDWNFEGQVEGIERAVCGGQ